MPKRLRARDGWLRLLSVLTSSSGASGASTFEFRMVSRRENYASLSSSSSSQSSSSSSSRSYTCRLVGVTSTAQRPLFTDTARGANGSTHGSARSRLDIESMSTFVPSRGIPSRASSSRRTSRAFTPAAESLGLSRSTIEPPLYAQTCTINSFGVVNVADRMQLPSKAL